ncbi:carbohydrate ABC transporter permease [Bacillus gobiensis]|uniref:carbohydrate ABC transporter permease n=1 Tax=Bacillus gobiensis TaxID=1441095 RepID=UPI003D238314
MKYSKTLYLFILPGFLIYAIFFVFPTFGSLFYSLTNWDGFTETFEFVGLDNYRRMATDTIFGTALTNNLKFMLVVVLLQFVFSLLFALFLKKNTKTNIFLRALYFFPTILSSVSVSFIWLFMYDPNIGVLNSLFHFLNFDPLSQNWLGNQTIAIYSVALVQVWFHAGQMIVIFVAGLQTIPEDLYEVAQLEGASKWQTFRHVTWPLVAPAATIVIAYTTIQSFKAFDLIFAMTRGGPNYATEILSTYIYNTAFQNNQFGYATAISMFFLLIVAVLTIMQFKLLRANSITY